MNVRNRVSGVDWEEILAKQARSGLSAKQFCLEHGIKPTSYYSATKRQRLAQAIPAADLAAKKASRAAELKAAATGNVSTPAAFVSVQVSDESDDVAHQAPALRVQLRGGHQLWVGAGFDAAHLSRLVAALESAS